MWYIRFVEKKNYYLSTVIFILLFAGYFIVAGLNKRKTFLPKAEVPVTQFSSAPTVNDFAFSYKEMLQEYGSINNIQVFSGGTVLKEFNDGSGNVYAGHLGSFWAPPFFSDGGNSADSAIWETGGFNFGLVFSDGNTCFTESPTDLNSEYAYWYPSKTVVKKNYEKIEITSARVPLPRKRGFALKLTLKNKTNQLLNYKVLYLGSLPTFDTLKEGNSANAGDMHYYGPWLWLMRKASNAKKSDAKYLSENSTVLVKGLVSYNDKTRENYSGFMAAGLNTAPLSWGLDDNKRVIYDNFRKNCQQPDLGNIDNDSDTVNSNFGLVGDFTQLGPAESKTVSLIVGLGESESQAIAVVEEYRHKEVESEADNWWNNRLQKVFSSLPKFSSGSPQLDKIYKNSVLTYMVNRWETYNSVSQSAGFGQSIGFFPWMVGTAGFFPLADAVQWKNQLIKIIESGIPSQNCRAFDFVSGDHLCDRFYAYDRVSMIDAVYRYISVTGDFAFINQTVKSQSVFDHLVKYSQVDEQRLPAGDVLKDFGDDWNLYEMTRHAGGCGYGGQYTGQVVSPNFERVVSYRQLAEMAEKRGALSQRDLFLQIPF